MASLISGLKSIASFSVSAFGMGLSLARIGMAVSKLKTYYEDWTRLQHHPNVPSSNKIVVVINGIFPCLEVASELMSFYNIGFEKSHFQALEEHRAVLETLYPSRNLNLVFSDFFYKNFKQKYAQAVQDFKSNLHWAYPNGIGAQEFESGLQQYLSNCPFFREAALVRILETVRSYQNKNAMFEKLHWIGLAVSLVKYFATKGVSVSHSLIGDIFRSSFVNTAITRGYHILNFHGKANCDYNLCPSGIASMALKLYFTPLHNLLSAMEIDNYSGFTRFFFGGPKPIQIGQFKLIRFTLTSSARESSAYYTKIPEKYYNKEPFCLYICNLNKTPITKALFIVEQEAVFLFERQALIEYVFGLKDANKLLVNPSTQNLFEEKDIYVDIELDHELTSSFMRLNDEERQNQEV